jgi:ribose 5-phosphate isomerase B
MRVAIGSDHRGFQIKSRILQELKARDVETLDCGTTSDQAVDYPDFASLVAQKVSQKSVERGILICGTGIGMAITANKFPGVRAATCADEITAEMCRRHNDVNVLCLPGDLLGDRPIGDLIRIWLETPFDGGRHERRLQKIADLEERVST